MNMYVDHKEGSNTNRKETERLQKTVYTNIKITVVEAISKGTTKL